MSLSGDQFHELGTAPELAVEPAGRRWNQLLRAVLRNPTGLAALIVLVSLVLLSLFAPWISPHDPVEQNLRNIRQPPFFAGGSLEFALGTDGLGRDLLSRLLHGGRTSLTIGIFSATASAILGTLLGLIAGYYGKRLGATLLRLADVQFAVPFTVVAIAVVATLGPSQRNLIVLLSVWGWAIYARTIANSVMKTKQLDFVSAVRLQGASTRRIMFRHIMPNVRGPVIVLWSTAAGVLILVESALSFVGLGVQAPAFSWGSMLSGSLGELRSAWWMAVFPGLILMLTIIAFNLVGDAIRDALNPEISKGKNTFRPNLS